MTATSANNSTRAAKCFIFGAVGNVFKVVAFETASTTRSKLTITKTSARDFYTTSLAAVIDDMIRYSRMLKLDKWFRNDVGQNVGTSQSHSISAEINSLLAESNFSAPPSDFKEIPPPPDKSDNVLN